MNWGRVKTVLIILFLCADLFLLGIYFTSIYSSSVISQNVISSTVSVLEVNGISVDASVIPQKMPKIPYTEAENVISDQNAFAKLLLGEDLSAIDFGYESNRGTLTFFGDRFNFQANSAIEALTDAIPVADEKSAKEISQKSLAQLGFDLSNATISVQKTESGYSVTFDNNANLLPIFNSRVVVTFSNHTLSSISGIWFNQSASSANNNLKSITAALIDFIPEAPQGITITKIEPGYDIFDKEAYHKSAALIPVWKLTCSDESAYYIDARKLN